MERQHALNLHNEKQLGNKKASRLRRVHTSDQVYLNLSPPNVNDDISYHPSCAG